MTPDAWITLAVVLGLLVAMMKDWLATDLLFLGAASFLALLGIITPTEAFAGFSNHGMLTVGVLFIVAAALRETGLLDVLGSRVLGSARTPRGALARLSIVTVPLSGFLNNTPIVSLFLPMVLSWCRRFNVPPSRLLIPLSYLAILGGTITLIGTSTNLVVNGLMIDHNIPGMGLFEISKIGIPCAFIGVAYLLWFGLRLLPDRSELIDQDTEGRREYLSEMQIGPDCRLAGQTVAGGGLRELPGLFLVEIRRGTSLITPVSAEEPLMIGDVLVFAGILNSIVELGKIDGLVPTADPTYEVQPKARRQNGLCEAVVSDSCPLIGRTIREADFRTWYGAAIVALHRSGRRLDTQIADVRLRPGDTLLLQTHPRFARVRRNDPAFHLVTEVPEWRPLRRDRAGIAGVLLVALLIMMATGAVPILIAASMVAVLLVAFGCISVGEARRSVEWQVLITIAGAFAVGTALEKSGAAAQITQFLFSHVEAWGPWAALAIIYIIASLFTELITNNAAAVLLFPICIEASKMFEVSPRPFLIALVMAASASFMTPIGYQTNMMVYGPGGYRYSDFLKVGTPLNILLGIACTLIIPIAWPF